LSGIEFVVDILMAAVEPLLWLIGEEQEISRHEHRIAKTFIGTGFIGNHNYTGQVLPF